MTRVEVLRNAAAGTVGARPRGFTASAEADAECHGHQAQAKPNALPQFKMRIDGSEIHFIHARSRHPNPLPLIIAHEWPRSVFQQIQIMGPLLDPPAFGGRAEDSFDVVIPSLPGTGFSARPAGAGWSLERIGRGWHTLMKRLGYTHYIAQGGDWGAGMVQAMWRQAPAGLLGIQMNMPAAVANGVGAALARSAVRSLIYFYEADRAGRFAMWERPELFAAELRAAFHSLR